MEYFSPKDPSEKCPRGIDFTDKIYSNTPLGDTIKANSISVVAFPSDMTVTQIGLAPSNSNCVTFAISNGSVGAMNIPRTYDITATVQTNAGYEYVFVAQQIVRTGGNS